MINQIYKQYFSLYNNKKIRKPHKQHIVKYNEKYKKQFFIDLSVFINEMEVETAKRFYYGFIKYIVSVLLEKKEILLPEIGVIRLLSHNPDKILRGKRKYSVYYTLKLKPLYKINNYFNEKLSKRLF